MEEITNVHFLISGGPHENCARRFCQSEKLESQDHAALKLCQRKRSSQNETLSRFVKYKGNIMQRQVLIMQYSILKRQIMQENLKFMQYTILKHDRNKKQEIQINKSLALVKLMSDFIEHFKFSKFFFQLYLVDYCSCLSVISSWSKSGLKTKRAQVIKVILNFTSWCTTAGVWKDTRLCLVQLLGEGFCGGGGGGGAGLLTGGSGSGLDVSIGGVDTGNICRVSGPRYLKWRLLSLQCSQATKPSINVVVRLVASSSSETNSVVSLMLSWQLKILCIWTPKDTNCQITLQITLSNHQRLVHFSEISRIITVLVKDELTHQWIFRLSLEPSSVTTKPVIIVNTITKPIFMLIAVINDISCN